jgi:hypothetical protein
MDESTESGLTVEYDEETGSFTLDWDPETHPEWNFLEGMTSEDFSEMLSDYITQLENSGTPTIKTEV